jgi:hypothetical protein
MYAERKIEKPQKLEVLTLEEAQHKFRSVSTRIARIVLNGGKAPDKLWDRKRQLWAIIESHSDNAKVIEENTLDERDFENELK